MPDWHYVMVYGDGTWFPYDHTGDPTYAGDHGWFPSRMAICASVIMDLNGNKWNTANHILAVWRVLTRNWVFIGNPSILMTTYACTGGNA